MPPVKAKDRREAATADGIRPMIELCRAGRLFEVQEWIAAGKPVNLPSRLEKRSNIRSPLETAIEFGFHSLVLVLLRGGATGPNGDLHGPLSLTLRMRRPDLMKLLVEHGLDPTSVDMSKVFDTWDPELMEYFIDRKADVETDNPLAYALCNRIQTALRVLKRYRERFPNFQEQANIALRHHCIEGNEKWIALMLWAGADPYATGVSRYNEEPDARDGGISALELAALYGHFEIFNSKKVKLDAKHPVMQDVAKWACNSKGIELLKRLLDRGLVINDQESGGSSTIQHVLRHLDWGVWRRDSFFEGNGHDSQESRDRMHALQLLVERGGRWVSEDKRELNTVRKGLLKLKAEYTAELVLIMTRHRACEKKNMEELLRTPTMMTHIERYQTRITKLLATWT